MPPPTLSAAVRAWPADHPEPLDAVLGGDHPPAVEAAPLVIVAVGRVQAVVASGNALRLAGPVRSHGILSAEGYLLRTVVDVVPHLGDQRQLGLPLALTRMSRLSLFLQDSIQLIAADALPAGGESVRFPVESSGHRTWNCSPRWQ